MKNEYKKGFTLVELSIVLVIIGLLIGGILVAQSLIDSTKIQTLTRAVGQYDAAVGTFKDRFGDLPGDSNLFNSAVGNGNGLVASNTGAGALTTGTWVGETANFWVQLSQTGLKNEDGGNYDPDATSGTGTSGINPGVSVPGSAVGSSTTGILAWGQTDFDLLDTATAAGSMNAYIVADCGAMSSETLSCQGGLKGADALAIDTKLDDGNGVTGDVRGHIQATDVASWALLAGDAAEVAYTPADTTENTVLGIRMGAATGVNY